MTVDLYGLSWDNYRESITGSLRHLIRDEDFVDVSLHCEGRVLKAHKVQFCKNTIQMVEQAKDQQQGQIH